jgi:hypothetical protein
MATGVMAALLDGLAVVIFTAAVGIGALAQAPLPGLRGGTDSLAAHAGQPVVLIVVDARRLGQVRHWAEDLMSRFPGLQLLTVADVNEQRPTTVDRVTAVLSRRVPPEAVVLIDIERRWARELDLDTAVPNLVLVDAEGEITARFRGRWNEQLASDVAGAIVAMSATGTGT